MCGVHHRVFSALVAHPGFRRAPFDCFADRAVAGEDGEIGERQRLLDGEIVQHRPRCRGELGDECVDLRRLGCLGRPAGRLDVDPIQQTVSPQRRDGLWRGVRAGSDDHSGRTDQRQLVHQRGRQDVEVVGIVDDEQQIALRVVTSQRCPGRPQQRSGLADVGPETRKVHQVAEGAERHHPLGRRAGDPADDGVRVPADELFGGQSGQSGFTAAVGSEYDGPGLRRITQGNVQLFQDGRMLGDVPSNRHRRILLRAVARDHLGSAEAP